MGTSDIFADTLQAKLQQLQYDITSLHLSVVRKEHEELTQEATHLRSENRYLHDHTNHERVNWKGTKALRHQEHQQHQDSLPSGEQSAQTESAAIAGTTHSDEPSHVSGGDAGPSASSHPVSPQRTNGQSENQVMLLKGGIAEACHGSLQCSSPAAAETPSTSDVKLEGAADGSSQFDRPSSARSRSRGSPLDRPLSARSQAKRQEADNADADFGPQCSLRSDYNRANSGWKEASIRQQAAPSEPSSLLIPGTRDSSGPCFQRTLSAASQGPGSTGFSKTMEVLALWQHAYDHLNRQSGRHSHMSHLSFGSRPEDFIESEAEDDEDEHCIDRCLSRFMVTPLSSKRIFWDVVSLAFLAWDTFFIPLKLFRPPEWQVVAVMLWLTRLFWTLDLPISFLTGLLMNDGNIEMKPFHIARSYMRTWLLPDIAMVVCDWLEIFIDLDAPWRLIKLLRLYRLARILKIPETLALIGERIWSEQVLLVANFIKIVGLVLGVAHLLACFWYGASQIEANGDMNWVSADGFESVSLFERYAMSFHWSLSQFVGGMDIVRPHNIWERTFAILVVLLTFVISAGVVSSITSSMTRLQFIAGNRSAQLSSLRRYLMDHRISRKLMMRIQRNAEHAMIEKQRNLPEGQVELLQVISEPLRVELHFEEHSPILSSHPFFELYSELCPAGMRKVCHHAVTTKVLWPGDVIFSNGETPTFPQMYFICSGTLQYQLFDRGTNMGNERVHAGQWACEGVLWMRWIHRGFLRVTTETRVEALSAKNFQDITCAFSSGFHPGFYAMEFVEHLIRSGHVSDLGDHEASEEIMQNAYNRIIVLRSESGRVSRKSTRKSEHAHHHSSRASTVVSKSEMRRSLRGNSFWTDSRGAETFLEEVRHTASHVAHKVFDVLEHACHTVVPGHHHGSKSKLSTMTTPRPTMLNLNSAGSPTPSEGEPCHFHPDSVPDIILDSNAAQPIMCTVIKNADGSADEDTTTHKRLDYSEREVVPLYPSGQPAVLEVEEFRDAEN